MCTMSMVMDWRYDHWRDLQPQPQPLPINPLPYPVPVPEPRITQAELDEFRDLLERARKYDREHGEPDCELDEKRQALKTLAKELGVEITFL